ncbi:unnamed protein product, partial [Amoebophrya sp. A25]|eukprot:GSA25T00003147001.1
MPLAYRTGGARDLTAGGTCCHTNNDGGDTNFRNWWRAAFPPGVTRYVSSIILWNREDCCTDKLDNARIMYDDYLGNAPSVQIAGPEIDKSVDLSGATSIGAIAGDAAGTTITVRRKINALTLFTKFDDTNGGILTLCGIHVIGAKVFQTTSINGGLFETVSQSGTKHYEGFPYLPLLYRKEAEDPGASRTWPAYCSRTTASSPAWWRVTFPDDEERYVSTVVIWNVDDATQSAGLNGARIIFNGDLESIGASTDSPSETE